MHSLGSTAPNDSRNNIVARTFVLVSPSFLVSTEKYASLILIINRKNITSISVNILLNIILPPYFQNDLKQCFFDRRKNFIDRLTIQSIRCFASWKYLVRQDNIIFISANIPIYIPYNNIISIQTTIFIVGFILLNTFFITIPFYTLQMIHKINMLSPTLCICRRKLQMIHKINGLSTIS